MAWCTLDPSNPQTTTYMEFAEFIGDIESYVRAEEFIGFRVFRVSPNFGSTGIYTWVPVYMDTTT